MLTNLTRSNVDTGTDQSTDDILTKYDPANKILADTHTSHQSPGPANISSNLRSEGRMDRKKHPPPPGLEE